MTLANNLYKFLQTEKNLFQGSHDVLMDQQLVEQILSQFDFKEESVLVLYNIEFIISLVYTYNVSPSQITFYSDHPTKSKLANRLGVKYITKLDPQMQFDNTISNVPYNTREDSYTGDVEVAGGKMGTVGDKTIGKKLNQLQRNITKPGGHIAQMGLKASMLDDALTDADWNPKILSLMVDKKWWDYNTFWAFGKKEPNTYSYQIYGTDIDSQICAKIFSKGGFKYIIQQNSYNQLVDNGFITNTNNGNPLCIVRNKKKKDMQILRAYPTDKGLKKVVTGPKFTHYMAESAITWLATDEPILCDCAVVWPHPTLARANKQKLFTEKNPLIKFMHKKIKFKGQDQFWFYTKFFDLDQIQTGLEMPAEYNLTPAEIKYINENFSRN